NQRQQRKQPSPGRAVQKHVGYKMHQDHDFQRQENNEFKKRFPSARNEIHHAARRLQDEKRQPEVPEYAKRASAAAAANLELRLDFRFEDFQVFVDAPGSHAPELAINQRQVRKYRQAQRQQRRGDGVGPEEVLHVSPNLRLIRASTRSISPRSVSWSYPSRCSTPWRIRICNSLAKERPNSLALRRAVAGEMAMSPRNASALERRALTRVRRCGNETGTRRSTAGNDSTSVGPFFLRKA